MIYIKTEIVNTYKVEREITTKNSDSFEYELEKFWISSNRYMILDLEKVIYLCNVALGIIARTALKAQKYNKELVLVGVKPQISELFEVVKFQTFTKIFSTTEDAVRYFKKLLINIDLNYDTIK